MFALYILHTEGKKKKKAHRCWVTFSQLDCYRCISHTVRSSVFSAVVRHFIDHLRNEITSWNSVWFSQSLWGTAFSTGHLHVINILRRNNDRLLCPTKAATERTEKIISPCLQLVFLDEEENHKYIYFIDSSDLFLHGGFYFDSIDHF